MKKKVLSIKFFLFIVMNICLIVDLFWVIGCQHDPAVYTPSPVERLNSLNKEIIDLEDYIEVLNHDREMLNVNFTDRYLDFLPNRSSRAIRYDELSKHIEEQQKRLEDLKKVQKEQQKIDAVGGPGGCFTSDTKVLMADHSFKNIMNIKVGDLVQSYDVEAKKLVPKEVTRFLIYDQDHYYLINGKLKVTSTHSFFTSEGEWKMTSELKIGDKIQNEGTGELTEINSKEKKVVRQKVYNFTVADSHTYFVSTDGVKSYLVSNTSK